MRPNSSLGICVFLKQEGNEGKEQRQHGFRVSNVQGLSSCLTRVVRHKLVMRQPPHKPPASASTPSAASERHGSTSSSSPGPTESAQSNNSSKNKTLLTTPQKRLNHIMSEQKRRNAIRDGYIQLTTLLAPAGAPPGAGMPTRGRPKGSGARGGRGGGTSGFKGKSGILFRAVEYIHWLEEGRDALREEVAKLEAAAGIQHPINA